MDDQWWVVVLECGAVSPLNSCASRAWMKLGVLTSVSLLSMKITFVPACLLMLSMVSCCRILVRNFRISPGGIWELLAISLMLSTHPSVIFFRIEAIPCPRSSFSAASASAPFTILILVASPSYSAAVLRRMAALISFMERMTSSGGLILLTCTLSSVQPPSFIFGPAQERILSARCDCDSKRSSKVILEAVRRVMFSMQESNCLSGSSISNMALAESSCLMRYWMEMSSLGKTLSEVRTLRLLEWTQRRLLMRKVSSMKGMQKRMPGPHTRFNCPKRVTTRDSLVWMNLKSIYREFYLNWIDWEFSRDGDKNGYFYQQISCWQYVFPLKVRRYGQKLPLSMEGCRSGEFSSLPRVTSASLEGPQLRRVAGGGSSAWLFSFIFNSEERYFWAGTFSFSRSEGMLLMDGILMQLFSRRCQTGRDSNSRTFLTSAWVAQLSSVKLASAAVGIRFLRKKGFSMQLMFFRFKFWPSLRGCSQRGPSRCVFLYRFWREQELLSMVSSLTEDLQGEYCTCEQGLAFQWEQKRCGTKQGLGRQNGFWSQAWTAFILMRIGNYRRRRNKERTALRQQIRHINVISISSIIICPLKSLDFPLIIATPQSSTMPAAPRPILLEGSRFIILYYLCSPTWLCMRDLLDSDSEHRPLSPTAFLADLSPPPVQLDLELTPHELAKLDQFSVEEGTFGSEKSARKKLAGLKSREKKKRQLESLEENVRALSEELEACECAISRCKDQLVDALKSSTSSEHSYTFAELERAALSSEGDLDRVNLLLDLIQNRVGANAGERRARLDYNFKQIINSLFPAMHRYLMHAALHHQDLFGDTGNAWTTSFYQELGLTPQQREGLTSRKESLVAKRRETVGLISKLKAAKAQLKSQEDIFERAITHFREEMNPIQSARLTLFGEKNKLRKQFSIFCDEFACEEPSKMLKKD